MPSARDASRLRVSREPRSGRAARAGFFAIVEQDAGRPGSRRAPARKCSTLVDGSKNLPDPRSLSVVGSTLEFEQVARRLFREWARPQGPLAQRARERRTVRDVRRRVAHVAMLLVRGSSNS